MSEEIDFAPAAGAPDRLGQGTAVEQSRAVAGVQAQVVVAWQRPRDVKQARARMLEACTHLELADDAFYSYPRGGETVVGMTVVAAVELAICWGNIDYGLTEMRRDDTYGQSEMLAFAWDLETNVRHAHTFIVQHVRSTKTGTYKLTDPRDVYELNTNDGSRRMRESIFKTLPRWYRTEAEKALRDTLWQAIGARSVEEGREKVLASYRSEFGIRRDQLEHKLRKKVEKWKAAELIELRILGRSISRGELRLDEAFPSARVTADELEQDAQAPKAAPRPVVVRAGVGHDNHPEDEWVDGCPGCIAESVAVDQAAADGDEATTEADDADA